MSDTSQSQGLEAKSLDDVLPLVNTDSRLVYAGLSEKARVWILLAGGFIAVLNLGFAWYFAFTAESQLQLQAKDVLPLQDWLRILMSNSTTTQIVQHELLARGMNIMVMLKLMANKHSLVLTCFGAAFALAAIGFSLFVIGADGAFKIMANSSPNTKLAVTGTAPGLLCFVLSALLICVGVTQKIAFNLPLLPYPMLQESAKQPAPVNSKAANGCSGCFADPAQIN